MGTSLFADGREGQSAAPADRAVILKPYLENSSDKRGIAVRGVATAQMLKSERLAQRPFVLTTDPASRFYFEQTTWSNCGCVSVAMRRARPTPQAKALVMDSPGRDSIASS